MAEVTLRAVGPGDDLCAVNELMGEFLDWAQETASGEYGVDLAPSDTRDVAADVADLQVPGGCLYLAEISDEPVGIGGLRPLSAVEGEIKRMYVRPSARGNGVGGAILSRLIRDARALGYRRLYLESGRFMRDAHALYRRYGFEPTDSYAGREFGNATAVDDIQVFLTLDLAPRYDRR
jgi:GNAT superfamily N-acetyltransferase